MIPLLAPLGLAVAATVALGALGERLSPLHTARLAAAAIAAVFVTVLAVSWVVAVGFVAHQPIVDQWFAWCRAIGGHHRVSAVVGLPMTAVALAASASGLRVARAWRRDRGGSAAVRVVGSDRPFAHAEAGRHGAIVVSTAMLAVLDDDERRALLAHERSHLANRHDRFLAVGMLGAGLAVLAPAVRALRHALERWADEDAADVVGSRTVVARAVARAALAGHDDVAPGHAGIAGADVPARVEALMHPPVRGPVASAWALVAAVAAVVVLGASAVQVHHIGALLVALCPS
ncbi:MAG: M56 family metallopeptidase [Actinomycetota bacterium]|nr:M56 family metallopeptidase [Actinomycetota bacterium]